MQRARLWMCAALALAMTMPAMAGDTSAGNSGAGEQQFNIGAMMASMGGPMKMGASDKGGLPEFDEVTKDMVKKEGMFTLWSYPDGAKDKDSEKLLAQIPSSFLGEKFMLSTSFSGGGFFTGFPLDQRVVQWELRDNQLLLVEPETGYVIEKGKEVSDVVGRTYPERIRVAVKVVTKSPSGDPLIDLGDLLKSDFADIGWMSMASFFGMGGGGGRINSDLSEWTKEKTFENNVEIGVSLAVSAANPPGSYDKKMVHYSFWKLPKTDYQPRIADDRVGYFLTTNQDWSKPIGERDLFNRYIDRWNLQKRDPSLALCEPKEPIIFYIEKTVPVKYRRAVRDGILEWNKAYEKIGFVGAVQVRQQTNDNEWADLDPEDMNHSFFRWIVTGAGFAMGPHRANPFTGEIYDADIIFDDAMVRYFEKAADRFLTSDTAMLKGGMDYALDAFLNEFPAYRRPSRSWEYFSFGDAEHEQPQVWNAFKQRMRDQGCQMCDYAQGMKQQMAFAGCMLTGASQEVKDKYLYDVIKEVVMHEVGHTLGLRHNFKASSIYTIAEIRERKAKGLDTCGSVMDYNPVLFFADKPIDGDFITTTIGPYDYWAIEYGYRPFDSSYTSASSDEKGDEDGDEEGDKKVADAAATKSGNAVFHGGSGGTAPKIDIDSIPAEVLSQLPPEIKAMLESGDGEKLMKLAQAHGMGGGMGGPTGAAPGKKGGSSGPSFKGAPTGEAKMLYEIAARSTEPQLAYATDEDTTFFGIDPKSNRFDMGSDALIWAETRMDLVNKRMENILEWAVKDQESWYHVRNAFTSLWFEKARVLGFVGRYIGGQDFNRSHRGDEGGSAPFKVVDAEVQRRAMSFIEEHLFADKAFEVSPEVLNHLAPARWWHEGTTISFTVDFPIHDLIATFQWWNLFDRLLPNTLRRIHDAEMKVNGSDSFTVAEYLQRLQKGVWGDALNARRLKDSQWTDNEPFISDVRRSLQREYLGLLEPLVRERPGRVVSPDLHAMVQYSLKLLGDGINEVIESGKADFASQAHLVACKSRIDRMLSPELDEFKPTPSFNMFGQTASPTMP